MFLIGFLFVFSFTQAQTHVVASSVTVFGESVSSGDLVYVISDSTLYSVNASYSSTQNMNVCLVDSTAYVVVASGTFLIADANFADSSTTLTQTSGAWDRIENAGGDLFTGARLKGFALGGDTLLVTITRTYPIDVTVSYYVSGTFPSADTCKLRILKNGTTSIGLIKFVGDAGMETYSATGTTVLSSGDYFELQTINIDDNDDAIIYNAGIVIRK